MKSDSQLQQDVIAELKWDPAVHASQIGVEAKDGVVTLAGQVDNFSQKLKAERAAQRVAGVSALTVEIDVTPLDSSRRSDVDIAQSARNILQWTACLPTDAIKVMVEGGCLTLTGEVDWQYQRHAAENGVRYLHGLVGLCNDITIKARVPIDSIKAGVESALERSSSPDHQNVSVAVHDGEVILTGSVHSWAERELAVHSAWSAPGVHNVLNEIDLVY